LKNEKKNENQIFFRFDIEKCQVLSLEVSTFNNKILIKNKLKIETFDIVETFSTFSTADIPLLKLSGQMFFGPVKAFETR
jgi:hypothetical protein